jgi:chromate reductase
MATKVKVAVLVGSLRKESFNRKVAMAMIGMGVDPLELEIVEYPQLPPYNQDDEANPPQTIVDFKQRIAAADAVICSCTPEYNRSMPGR